MYTKASEPLHSRKSLETKIADLFLIFFTDIRMNTAKDNKSFVQSRNFESKYRDWPQNNVSL